MMKFDRFVRDIDEAVRAAGAAVSVAAKREGASWTAGDRGVEMAVLPPQNISLTLTRPGTESDTTWYPIDAALVPVISQRIARFFKEP
jgi:hypothetical protein